jgi:regulator of PEP synthase PpsR (kinase-PPPase family)
MIPSKNDMLVVSGIALAIGVAYIFRRRISATVSDTVVSTGGQIVDVIGDSVTNLQQGLGLASTSEVEIVSDIAPGERTTAQKATAVGEQGLNLLTFGLYNKWITDPYRKLQEEGI